MTRQLARTVTAQKPCNSPLKRMEPETGQVHIHNCTGSIEAYQNVTQFHYVCSNHAARVIIFIEAFQSLVAYRPDHPIP